MVDLKKQVGSMDWMQTITTNLENAKSVNKGKHKRGKHNSSMLCRTLIKKETSLDTSKIISFAPNAREK